LLKLDNDKIVKSTNEYSGAILLDVDNNWILQKRDNRPGLKNAGKISFFGGGCEPGENSRQCLVRELTEEIELAIQPGSATFFGDFIKENDEGKSTVIHIFIIKNVEIGSLRVHEGEGAIVMNPQDVLESDRTSDIAKDVAKMYLESHK
jgi:8-oxo-dGTP pyrophosphatase MutT (NUDIX family)